MRHFTGASALKTQASVTGLHQFQQFRGLVSHVRASANLHQRFNLVAAERLDAIAIAGPERLTYQDLSQISDAMAAELWSLGLRPQDRAVIEAGRSARVVAAMLAIRKIGAAYVPLEPALPAKVRAAQLADAAPTVLVADHAVDWTGPLLRLDAPLPLARAFEPAAEDTGSAAYVMYTSGSTGAPKGVVVPVRGVLRLAVDPDYVTLGPSDVVLHAAPLGFDASTFEIWGTLLNGGTLAIVPDQVPSLDTLAEAIAAHGVTTAWLTSGMFHAMVDHRLAALMPLRQLLAGGDVLSPAHVARALAGLPDTILINGYGPTENTTFTCCYRIPRDHPVDAPVPIGRPIRGTQVLILDETGAPVPPGKEGELCAAGDGVALGYLNQPELTAAAFRPAPDGRLLYHTGDRARMRADGVVEFAGRRDRQVKIRGRRVALDEVEAELRRDPAVRDAAVQYRNGRAEAFVTGPVDATSLRRAMLARLPDHMVPATITVMDALPLTRNGKLDRKALQTSKTGVQAVLTRIWRNVLGRDDLDAGVNLFDGGATSMDVVQAHAAMADAGLAVSLPDLFAYPTIQALAAHLDGRSGVSPAATVSPGDAGIAIIGMAARLPGADDVEAFWSNLCSGIESISRLSLDSLDDAYPTETRRDPAFVAARPVLRDIEGFEPSFFGMTTREAEMTDPQQRVFLELAWEVFEAAGYDPAKLAGRVGVFAGSSPNSYLLRNVLPDRAAVLRYTSEYQTGSYPVLLGAGADFLATRVAYKLDLTGPAMTIATACSTGLVAVSQAAASLRRGEADLALAGGVSITLPQRRGYLHQPGGLASADGHVRPFDAAASGTVFGSGAGIVLLKRLDDALRDGDHIHAVIRGTGINNDGATKVGFTAPSIAGQAACIRAALAQANAEPASIGYLEAHGTATPLGDPIEFAALQQVFADGSPGQCVLGSVKGNIGHLDAAAGIAGLIKAGLAVERGVVPGTMHYRTPNPAIDLASSPFVLSAATQDWDGPSPRRAGVSAFGVGGTNAHVVLEQAPAPHPAPARADQVLILSARSEAALDAARHRLAGHLAAHPGLNLADVAWTLHTGRRRFQHRLAVACTSVTDAAAALQDGRTVTGRGGNGQAAFLFPGQGSQYAGMGRGLYAAEPVYRAAVDACAQILQRELGSDIRTALHGTDHGALRDTSIAQPALFTVSYATARLWQSWGITPAAMLGHSVGEFVAACLAGVFTLDGALRLIAGRSRLMAGMEPGAMLAVRLPLPELAPLLGNDLDLAAVNGPSLCVAAGSFPAIAALEARLDGRGALHRRLHTSHAFHSRMMDAVVAPLRQIASDIPLSAPDTPFVSCVTGALITDAQAQSPDYWAQHCRAPVQFAAGLDTILAGQPGAVLECGPGRTLTTLALQGAARGQAVVPSLPDAAAATDDGAAMAAALAHLAAAGVEADWAALHGAGQLRLPLPTTPWDRIRCWIDEPGIEDSAVTERTPMDQAAVTDDTLQDIVAMFEDLSGDRIAGADPATNFLSLGFDSLFLGQVAQQLGRQFGVTVTFRQLMSELGSFGALARHVAANRPARPATAVPASKPAAAPPVASAGGDLASLMQQQVAAMSALFAQQLAALGGSQPASEVARPAVPAAENTARFDAFKPAAPNSGPLTPGQREHIQGLVAATNARTPASKRMTAEARSVLADPRAAAGFRPDWKDMTYPIVAVRSAGPLIWDADGNEYVDLVNGFGQTAFGHAPAFVNAAVQRQLEQGYAIGPQAAQAGALARRFCAMTGNERMTFCNTGSEAVMASMRVARTVTGRTRIVTFAGSYHGQFDEVLVKATPKGTRPASPGIPASSVEAMTVLEYGTDASLDWIRQHANELAAVIVEPVQSRHPSLRPLAFLQELRAVTERAGVCLVFDEVVTGFRTHPGGMQAVFNIRADLATYGKVIGGGLPIGILAGKSAFMDTLDGGDWRYGDDSIPEAAVTFFAGTFVRHPLALAAMEAVLDHIEAHGDALYGALFERSAALVQRLNAALAARGLPACVEGFASWFYFKLPDALASLLYAHMRLRGVHIQEGFPCFLTTTHGQAEIDRIVAAFTGSLDALQAGGILLPDGAALPPAPAPAPADAPLTEAQMEVWLAAQMGDAASCAFNEGVCLHMQGSLDVVRLRQIVAQVLARHDALRARFTPTGDRMIIGAPVVPALDVEALELDAVLQQEAANPFDLVAGPPIRLRLVQTAPDHHVLVITAHHIVCDGWSINTLLSEIAQPQGFRPALSFAAYAASRRESRAAADTAWWQQQFADLPEPLDLPADRQRPALRSFRGGTRRLRLDAALAGRVKAAGGRHGCTLFATLLATVSVLLGRLAARQDVVVAVPAAAQSQLDGQVLVGHCANLLPLRTRWTEDTPFADHLAAVRDTVLDAYEHQDCTLGTIVRALDLPRDTSRLPLTDVQFNLEKLADGIAMPGLAIRADAAPKAFVNFDLFFNAVESTDGITIDCDYNADLFDPQTVDRWLGHLRTVLAAVADDPAQPVNALPLLSAGERDELLNRWNATQCPLPALAVHRLIAARAADAPHAPALQADGRTVSYGELDAYSNQLAHHLLRQAAPGSRVAVMMDRGRDLVAVLLAVWKAGMAYVPLDPVYPRARLDHIAADAGVAVLVTDGTGPDLGVPAIDVRRARVEVQALSTAAPDVADYGLAYVIYTSGSTGKPKGVAIGHRALANLLLSIGREPGIAPGDIWLAVTTIAFDIAGLEIWGPLVAGAQVVLTTRDEAADGHLLRDRLERSGTTIMQATPATWRLLLEAGWQPGTLTMLCGGEALPRTLADQLIAGGGALWNMYGPTETTIWSALDRVGDGAVTIGHPVANTHLHVLDRSLGLLPAGVPGELYIGGAGLADGYLGQPGLTADRFIPNPFAPGEQLYRTGDRARRLPDGRIQVIGRVDSQIKLRGYRLEAEEVEHVLTAYCGVAAAAVAVRPGPDGEPRLAAWIVEREPATDADLRRVLRRHLPDYMVPSSFMAMASLPLTPNGKIDRAALPDPLPRLHHAGEPPRPGLETVVAEIWTDVLRQPVSRDDDLLALGADSIQLFQITARLNAAGHPVLARHLLQHRTVKALAASLSVEPALPPSPAASIPTLQQFRRDRRVLAGD